MNDVLAAMNHHARCAWAIDAGRRAFAGDTAVREQLLALERGTVSDRRLAVIACATSRDGEAVLRATSDPSERVRARAYALVPLVCDERQTTLALQRAWEVRRDRAIVEALRDKGSTDAIDAHLQWLMDERKDPRACDLLPCASETFVRAHLDRALDRPSAAFWKRLGRYAPNVLADVLAAAIERDRGAPDPDWKRRIEDALPDLCAKAPDGALRMIRALLERGLDPQGIATVARYRPGAVLALLLPRGPLPDGLFTTSVARLTEAERAAAIASNPRSIGTAESAVERCGRASAAPMLRAWLPVADRFPAWGGPLLVHADGLEPEARERVFEAWSRAAQNAEGVIARERLDALPTDLQEREARRHLHRVTELTTRPATRITYAEHLPWDEAVAELAAYAGHPEGAMRGVAAYTLLRVVGHRVAETELPARGLALVRAKKHEQDPVRRSMLGALATWPKAAWRREHLADVSVILRDALDAADLSQHTAQLCEGLVLALFGLDAAWGSEALATLVRERGVLYNPRLGDHLDDVQVAAAGPALLAIATTWSSTERHPQFLALVTSLGKRVSLVSGLVDLLQDVHTAAVWPYVALEALVLIHRVDPDRYERLFPAFLTRWSGDTTWGSPILALARRLDALDDRLANALLGLARSAAPAGIVSEALTVLRKKARPLFDDALGDLLRHDESLICLPLIHGYVHRRRQDLLDPFLGQRVIRGRFASGHTRWVLPFKDGFFRWNPAQQRTFAATLGALLDDRKRDTPTLLGTVAILPRIVDAPAERLIDAASDERPAVREKAIRALGRCDAGQGVPTLVTCLADERARYAIYALRRALLGTRPAAATAALVGVPRHRVTVAKEVVRLLGELRCDEAYAHLVDLDASDLHRDVRIALLRALWDHLEREPSWPIFTRAATGPDHVMAARVGDVPADRLTVAIDARLSALLASVLERPEPEARIDLLRRAAGLPVRDVERRFLRAVGTRLAARTSDEQHAATYALLWRATDRDRDVVTEAVRGALGDRRALATFVDTLVARKPRGQVVLQNVGFGVLTALAADPRSAPVEFRLAGALMNGLQLAVHVVAMSAAGRLHVGVLEDPSWRATIDGLAEAHLEPFEHALAAHADEVLRLAALRALVRSAGPGQGWTLERRARLAAFQQDASFVVSGAAQRIDPPREESSP